MVAKIRKEIIEEKGDAKTPILVIANKCDLYRQLEAKKKCHLESREEPVRRKKLSFMICEKEGEKDAEAVKQEGELNNSQKNRRRNKSIGDLLNGRRWSVNKEEEEVEEEKEKRWREILVEMEQHRVQQAVYSNIEQAIERLTSPGAQTSILEGLPRLNNLPKRSFVPRYSLATYNVYNRDLDTEGGVLERKNRLMRRNMSTVEGNYQSFQLLNKRKQSFLHSYMDNIKNNKENHANEEYSRKKSFDESSRKLDAILGSTNRKCCLEETNEKKFLESKERLKEQKSTLQHGRLVSIEQFSPVGGRRRSGEEKRERREEVELKGEKEKQKKQNDGEEEEKLDGEGGGGERRGEGEGREEEEGKKSVRGGILVRGRRYSCQGNTKFTMRAKEVQIGETKVSCRTSELRKSSAGHCNLPTGPTGGLEDVQNVLNDQPSREERTNEINSYKDTNINDEKDESVSKLIKGVEEGSGVTAVDKEVVESIVTMDWAHGYAEISAKMDDDISTCIFKALLSQVSSFLHSRSA